MSKEPTEAMIEAGMDASHNLLDGMPPIPDSMRRMHVVDVYLAMQAARTTEDAVERVAIAERARAALTQLAATDMDLSLHQWSEWSADIYAAITALEGGEK